MWRCALRQDGEVHEIKGPDGEWISYQVAELTGVRDLTGRPEGMRLIVRRVKPSRRDLKKLTVFEQRTGWRYQIVATNITAHRGLSAVPGSGQVWFVDALYRDHAEVEDRVKAIKRVGLGLLPLRLLAAERRLGTGRSLGTGRNPRHRPGRLEQTPPPAR